MRVSASSKWWATSRSSTACRRRRAFGTSALDDGDDDDEEGNRRTGQARGRFAGEGQASSKGQTAAEEHDAAPSVVRGNAGCAERRGAVTLVRGCQEGATALHGARADRRS